MKITRVLSFVALLSFSAFSPVLAPVLTSAAEPDAAKSASPPGLPAAVLEATKPLFDGKSLEGWMQIPAGSWNVKDGAMASVGAGRGVIFSRDDYSKFRLVFLLRHVSGKPDHQPCVLIFCTRPEQGKKPLDALGGIQFQPPNGGHWDYRPGHNKGGTGFTKLPHAKFNVHEWCQVELLVDATAGTADGGRPTAGHKGRGSPALQKLGSRQNRADRPSDAQQGPLRRIQVRPHRDRSQGGRVDHDQVSAAKRRATDLEFAIGQMKM